MDPFNDAFVYPGQPAVIACQIMTHYPDYQTASETGHTFRRALEDSRIHGAGGAVYSGLAVLRAIDGGEMTPEAAFDYGQEMWRQARGNGRPNGDFAHNLDVGLEKADAIREQFLELVAGWAK